MGGSGALIPHRMRISTELEAAAILRRCSAAGAAGFVMRRGDGERGALYVKVATLDGRATLFGPAPASFDDTPGGRTLTPHLDAAGVPERDVDAYMTRQIEYDPDLWLIEIEDRQGRNFIAD